MRTFRFIYGNPGETFDRQYDVQAETAQTARYYFRTLHPKVQDRVRIVTVNNVENVIHELGETDARQQNWIEIQRCCEQRDYKKVLTRLNNMRYDSDFNEAFEIIARTVAQLNSI